MSLLAAYDSRWEPVSSSYQSPIEILLNAYFFTGRSYGRQVEWMDATGKELSLWQNMLDRPNFWVEGSLVLRSSLDGIRANLP